MKNDKFRDEALDFLTREPAKTTKYSQTPTIMLSPFERKKTSALKSPHPSTAVDDTTDSPAGLQKQQTIK